MKKWIKLLVISLGLILQVQAQKLNDLPIYTGSPAGKYVPIVVNGSTMKIDASKFSSTIDSTGLAFLPKNNKFTGDVDTFKSITINDSYGIDNTGYGSFNGLSSFGDAYISGGLHLGGYNISAISNDGTLAGNSASLLPSQQAVKTYVDANSGKLPYKVYAAKLTQTGTSAPTATVLQNTLGGTILWLRASTGQYWGLLSGATLNTSTTISPQNEVYKVNTSGYGYILYAKPFSGTRFDVLTNNTSNSPEDGDLSSTFVEIRVYP